jgi:hypothetical protein
MRGTVGEARTQQQLQWLGEDGYDRMRRSGEGKEEKELKEERGRR